MQKKKIIVTGGCGYIGGHTIVDLLENGFEVISIDDMSRGSLRMLDGIEKITGTRVINYNVNLCDGEKTKAVFALHPDVVGIIHFAAYKSVPESVGDPLLYYRNNIGSLITILECAKEFSIPSVVFSSSCSVYGNAQELPVTENTLIGSAESPYARTKQLGEAMCKEFSTAHKNCKTILLRYFNPAGAHPSALIGEIQEKPENLVPVITQTAIGKRDMMQVFGDDYATRDGSCVRDYIHVSDIAHAHTQALLRLMSSDNKETCEIFNLGSGKGVTVLELIQAFEKVSGTKLNYTVVGRRPGDVVAIYSDNTKAREVLNWQTKYSLEDIMSTAWKWEQVGM